MLSFRTVKCGLQIRIDHLGLDRFSDEPQRVQSLPHLRDLSLHYFSQHDHTAIRSRKPLAGAIRNRSLGFPRHVILRLHLIHPESGKRMQRIRRIFVRLNVFDFGIPGFLDGPPVCRRIEADKENLRVRVIHGHADLGCVPLAQNIGKN